MSGHRSVQRCDFFCWTFQWQSAESLSRLVVQGIKPANSQEPDTECPTVCQLHSPQQLRTTCTEHKPGYLHAATQWAPSATATPLQLNHANVTTNVNGTYLCNLSVRFLHFESLWAKSVTVKINIYTYIPKKKKIHRIVFSWWNV